MNTLFVTADFVILLIIIEIAILFLLLIAIFFRRLLGYFLNKKTQKNRKRISQILNYYLQHERPWDPQIKRKEFSSWKNLLIILEEFNHRFQGVEWDKLKSELIQSYLIKKARKWANSRFWMKRNYAARCFALSPFPEDVHLIRQLIDDHVFLVRSVAMLAAIHLDDRKGILKTLRHMTQESGYSRCFYRDILSQGSKNAFKWIIEIARLKQDSARHLACLEILSSKTMTEPLPFLARDTRSQDDKIRLAALEALTRNPQEGSMKIFLHALKDPDEEIRAQAVLAMGNFTTRASLSELKKALKDEAWIVRLNAAETLYRYGEEGIAILKSLSPKTDPEAYGVSRYVLQFGS